MLEQLGRVSMSECVVHLRCKCELSLCHFWLGAVNDMKCCRDSMVQYLYYSMHNANE
jgi:hypothetical protein